MKYGQTKRTWTKTEKLEIVHKHLDEHISVTESMNSPEIRERELTPLRKIPDNYEKSS